MTKLRDRIRMEGKSERAIGSKRKKEGKEREKYGSTGSTENIGVFFGKGKE